MKNSVKTTTINNSTIANFNAAKIKKEQLKTVKGGEDIIVQDVIMG